MEEKIKEVLSKFPDAEQRFKKSAIFNRVVNALARGGDPYSLINDLITSVESAHKLNSDILGKQQEIRVILDPPRPEADLPKWLQEGLDMSNRNLNRQKNIFAKRLKKEGVQLLYGYSELPVSMIYKESINPIISGTKLANALRHIDKETWNSVE